MDEFNLDDNIEIGTPVLKLQNLKNKEPTENTVNNKPSYNKQINNDLIVLIKDLESRLDNLEESKPIESVQVFNEPKKIITKINNNTNKVSLKYYELIIYLILFILLNNQFTVTLIHNLPYFKKSNSSYPNLILRTLLFGLIIYLYKKYVK
jgi:hypothetical protein